MTWRCEDNLQAPPPRIVVHHHHLHTSLSLLPLHQCSAPPPRIVVHHHHLHTSLSFPSTSAQHHHPDLLCTTTTYSTHAQKLPCGGKSYPASALKNTWKYWSTEKVVKRKVVQNKILDTMVFVHFSLRAIFWLQKFVPKKRKFHSTKSSCPLLKSKYCSERKMDKNHRVQNLILNNFPFDHFFCRPIFLCVFEHPFLGLVRVVFSTRLFSASRSVCNTEALVVVCGG